MPAKTFYNRSRGAVDLACGEIVAAGGTSTRVDMKDPHDKALVDGDVLVEQKKPTASQAANPEQEGDQ